MKAKFFNMVQFPRCLEARAKSSGFVQDPSEKVGIMDDRNGRVMKSIINTAVICELIGLKGYMIESEHLRLHV